MPEQQKAAALILQGTSDYNALSGLNHELALAFRARGLEPVMVDLLDKSRMMEDINRALKEYGQSRILAAFSFSGMGIQLEDNQGNLWQRLRLPVVSWLIDHPAYYLKRHSYPSPAIMRLYTTKDFLEFNRDYVKAPFRTAYCPLGAMGYGKEPQSRELKPGAAPLILFPKSLGQPALLEERWSYLPFHMRRIIFGAIDHYWDTTPRSGGVTASVLAAADAVGLELRNDLTLFSFFIAQLDHYIRGRKSHILAKELLKLPVRIYSKDSGGLDTEGAKALIMKPVNYDAMMDLFHEALAVVSVNPNIDDQTHDRVYSSFGSGALPVTDINPWWRQNYPELLPYSYDFRDKPVTAAIEKVLADPAAAADAAWQAGAKMRTARPWKKMVEEAVEWALVMRYFAFNFITPVEGYVRHEE
jgi:hypothetical protein